MWKHLWEQSFPMTEEEYDAQLDAVCLLFQHRYLFLRSTPLISLSLHRAHHLSFSAPHISVPLHLTPLFVL
jgi:hypothetical protein